MKRFALLLAAVALVSWAGVQLWAADGDAPRPPQGDGPRVGDAPRPVGERPPVAPRPEGRPSGDRGGDRGLAEFGRFVEQLGLTADQQKLIAEIVAARQKEMMEIQAKYQGKVNELLTPDQRAKLNTSMLLGPLERDIRRAELTPEQLDKIKAKAAELSKDINPADEKVRGEVMQKLRTFIMGEVLTEAQKAVLREAPRDGVREGLPQGERQPAGGDNPRPTGGERRDPPPVRP